MCLSEAFLKAFDCQCKIRRKRVFFFLRKSIVKLEVGEISLILLRFLCPQFNIILNRIVYPWCTALHFLSQLKLFS